MDVPSRSWNSEGVCAPSIREIWGASARDNVKVYSEQLFTVGGAAALAKTSVAPLERIKILLQTQPMTCLPNAQQYRGLRDALARIPRSESPWALWRGNGANIARIFPEIGLRCVINDQLEILFSPTDGSPPTTGTHIAAGAATGVLKTVLLHPFDLVHTRLAADASPKGQPRLYNGLLHCLLQTGRGEGWRALWKGVIASSAGTVPYMATSFTVYHELSGRLPSDRESRDSWWYPASKVAIGASASTLGQAVAYPIDTVRRRMQLSGSQGQAICYSGYWHCIRNMARAEGMQSFYRGVGVNCLKAWPGATVQFLAFDALRTSLMALSRTTL